MVSLDPGEPSMAIPDFTEWIESGFDPVNFPAVPLQEDDRAQFIVRLADILSGLDEPVLLRISGYLPSFLTGKIDTNEAVDTLVQIPVDLSKSPVSIYLLEIAGDLLIADENWDRAIDVLSDALDRARIHTRDEEISIILNNRGVCYYRLNRYTEARDDLLQSLMIAEKIDNDRRRARARINLGLLYKDMGKLEEAAGHYRVALELARKEGDEVTVWACYLNIGNIYRELGRWDDGKKALEKTVSLARNLEPVRLVHSRHDLGVLLLEEGAVPEQAADLFRDVIRYSEENNTVGAVQLGSIAKSNLALALLAMGDADQALKLATDSLEASEKINDPDGIWRAGSGIAKARAAMGDVERAEEAYLNSINNFEDLQWELKSDRDRSEFRRNLKDLVGQYIEYSLQTRGPRIAFARLASSKARGLSGSAGKKARGTKPDIDEEKLLGEILSNLEAYKDSVIIDYFLHGTRLRIFTMNSGGVEVYESEIKPAQIENLIHELRSEMNLFIASKEYRDSMRARTADVPECLVSLSDILIGPVIGRIQDAKHIFFVPQGILFHIPFGALTDPESEYLSVNYSVTILPSSDFLTHGDRDQTGIPERIHVVRGLDEGIEEVEHEIGAIGEMFGEGMTLGGFKEAGKAEIIHYTGHAEFDPVNPYASSLVLNDGSMLSLESMGEGNFDFTGVRLVTLAGCETGTGEVLSGDEFIGLSRAFLAAGVETVLASLWKVDDVATSRLIITFYENLRESGSASDALKKAAGSMIGEIKVHPYFFAPFILMGRG